MARFRVYGYTTLSCFAEVEADNETEAREKFECLATPPFCWQCSSAGEGTEESGEVKLDGYDGECTATSAEKVK